MKNLVNVDYAPKLAPLETINAINFLTEKLITDLSKKFNLVKIENPVVCTEQSGVNDDYQMTERPINFEVSGSNLIGEFIQGLTKWRRLMIDKLQINKSSGLLTDGKWVKRDHNQSRVQAIVNHEIGFDFLVDSKEINQSYLMNITNKIIDVIKNVEEQLLKKYPFLTKKLSDNFLWLEVHDLHKKMPLLIFEEQLNRFTRDEGPIILYHLQDTLSAGNDDLSESQDVFNWQFYAKIYVYDFVVEQHLCLANCGFTVDRDSLEKQRLVNKEIQKIKFDYENLIAKNTLPITFSCNINKAALDLFLLEKGHISEVISSVWDEKFLIHSKKRGVDIL